MLNKGDFSYIIVLLVFVGICITVAIIMNIIGEKNRLVEQDDFISAYIRKKRKFLAANKSGINENAYIVILILSMLTLAVAAYFVMQNLYVSLACSIIGFFIPDLIIKMTSQKQNAKFELKYKRSLSDLSSSLRAGMSIPQAVEKICHSQLIDEDIKKHYKKMNSSLKMGKSIKEAFYTFAEDVQSNDAFDVAAAIAMQEKVGGGEAEVIENITNSIAERIDERIEIDSILMESSMMIWVFDAVPFVLIVILYVMMPSYILMYFENIKNFIVFAVIIGFTLIGAVVARGMKKKALDIG